MLRLGALLGAVCECAAFYGCTLDFDASRLDSKDATVAPRVDGGSDASSGAGGTPGVGGRGGHGGTQVETGGTTDQDGGVGGSVAVGGAMGQGGTGGSSGMPGGAAGHGGEDGSPEIASTSPSAGERGVLADTDIVVAFSAPMDRVATEQAFESIDLGAVAFTWNEAGTVLTVDPTLDLAYAAGANPETTEARSYTFSITSAAEDALGNKLKDGQTVTFHTSREITVNLPEPESGSTGGLTGYAIDGSTGLVVSTYVDPCAGDTYEDFEERGFATFNLDTLPSDVQAITAAELSADQGFRYGNPFALGALGVEHVAYSTLTTGFGVPARSHLGALFEGVTADTGRLDVSTALLDDFLARDDNGNQTQFRFRFDLPTDGDGVTDDLCLSHVNLRVSYLLP